jgi:hypothetical protein
VPLHPCDNLEVRPVHITRARARASQACARLETRLAFTCPRKSSSTLLQLQPL